ncbi:MAG: hypothetical protein PVI23_05535 [Maricaulaceae bacterium]|jgi:hypothetical protein
MSKLDDAIHEALSEEDAEFLSQFDKEPNAFQQMFGIFSGPLGWIFIMFVVFALILAPITFYTGWKFFTATELRPLLYWGATTGVFLMILSIVRILSFMQLQTNALLRELKRLELQIARLAARDSV